MDRLSAERVDRILDRMRTVRVAVVGDLMLDVYLAGDASRISPEAPVPVVHVKEERVALGGAANVAANVSALGGMCHLVGCVGADQAATQLRTALDGMADSITARLICDPGRPTTTKTRIMARHQQVVRFDREQEVDLNGPPADQLAAAAREAVTGADVVVLEDYNKGVLTPSVIKAVLRRSGGAGIPSIIDPKFRNFFAHQGATVFKPNALELAAAFGRPPGDWADEELDAARKRLGCGHLLVTLGEAGMLLRSSDGRTLRVPAVARDVYDVSGAGDTVTAVVALALPAGATIGEAAVLANVAAAIEVGKQGVATVTAKEIRRFLAQHTEEDSPFHSSEVAAHV